MSARGRSGRVFGEVLVRVDKGGMRDCRSAKVRNTIKSAIEAAAW